MLDQYIWGDVGRISPEAPVPIVRATHRTEQPGGAANVALNIARLGARATIVGFTGTDDNERALKDYLSSNRVEADFVSCEGFPTITKLRILSGRQQMLRLDNERAESRPSTAYQKLIERALHHLPQSDALILSDYAKGVLLPEVCQTLIQAAAQRKIPVLVDPKNVDFSRYRGATTISPNLGELALAARVDLENLNDLLYAAQQMVRNLGLSFLTATLGEKGIALVTRDKTTISAAVARQVFDVSGAGDAVIATLSLSLASGLDPELGVHLANLAGAIVVSKVGTAPVEQYELLNALTAESVPVAQAKVVTRSELLELVARWRRNDERIVVTNGCFDLLHVGHISLLEQARGFGDRLVVAINSDRSVRELKGNSRPIVGEQERARVLAAIAAVDAVVIFDERTPLELIEATRPDVLVKGGDYAVSGVVGAEEVQSWGGHVKIVPIVEGFSTTKLIEKGH